MVSEITTCEVCGNNRLPVVLDLGLHALCDDLVRIGEMRECQKYPIVILFCDCCRTAHQRYQVPKEILFPSSYHYRAALTADVINGMTELLSETEQRFGPVRGRRVLDIGCNDGSLLTMFRERGALTFGIEPTGAAADARARGHTVLSDYFSPDAARSFREQHGQPDFVTFTNVFAHIEHLEDVLAGLHALLHDRSVLVIENHYLGSVLATGQFDTFYHEHPRTYSYRSFEVIAQRLGLQVSGLRLARRYGGNVRVFLARNEASDVDTVLAQEVKAKEEHFLAAFQELRSKLATWRRTKRELLTGEAAKSGKLRAKAFPARASILIELLGLTSDDIAAVYEQPRSPKIGHYVPGTRIPIVSETEFDQSDSRPVINLAWHIPQEIERHMRSKLGFRGEIIPIMSPDEFAPGT